MTIMTKGMHLERVPFFLSPFSPHYLAASGVDPDSGTRRRGEGRRGEGRSGKFDQRLCERAAGRMATLT